VKGIASGAAEDAAALQLHPAAAGHMPTRRPAQRAQVAGDHHRHLGAAQIGARGIRAVDPLGAGLSGLGLAAELDQEHERVGVGVGRASRRCISSAAGLRRLQPIVGRQLTHAGQRGIEEIGAGLQVPGPLAKVIGHRCACARDRAVEMGGEQIEVLGQRRCNRRGRCLPRLLRLPGGLRLGCGAKQALGGQHAHVEGPLAVGVEAGHGVFRWRHM
jgi:hypothetical protein